MSRRSATRLAGSRRRGREDGDAAFRRAFGGTVGVLVVFCLVFLGLTVFQGPKLSSAIVDGALVTKGAGQQLRLFANQQVAQVEPDQVVISPDARFTVATQGDIISITFEEPLHYGTEYAVEVQGVTSIHQNRPSTFRHEFRTETSAVFLLDRADPDSGDADRIVSGVLGSDGLGADGLGSVDTVYRDIGILDFAVVGQAIAVVTATADDDHRLSLVSLFDGAVEHIGLPGQGTIDELRASSEFSLGFRFTSAGDPLAREYSGALLWMDLEGVHVPEAVEGLAPGPLTVSDWSFVPGSDVIVALDVAQSLMRIDPKGAEPTIPLGTWEGLDDISYDGSTAIVRDLYDTIIYSFADGSEQPFGPTPIDGVFPFGGQVELLGNGPSRVQKLSLYDAEEGVFSSLIVVDDGVASRTLFRSEGGTSSIDDISVSPNGQFVAIEFVPDVATAVSDAYYPFARADTVRTLVIDIATARTVADIPGFAIAW